MRRAPARPAAEAPPLPGYRRLWPLVSGVVALGLAGLGEARVEAKDTSVLSLALYVLGILLFAWSAADVPAAPADLPAPATGAASRGARRDWIILAVGTGLATAICGGALGLLWQNMQSEAAAWLWLGGIAVLLGTGIAAARVQGWPARWGHRVWPTTGSGRWLAIGAIVLVLAVAAGARFWALDHVPLGLNADEGDRTAVSIRILRGTDTDGIFQSGWYYISMVYFWLLAIPLKLLGISYVSARGFSAVAGMIAVGAVTWLGVRHFGLRVGLLAALVLTTLNAPLQFSRLTSEAGPTSTLWALSMALFLEAARRGRLWAWIGAGLAGGFSIYFYPTGRLWPVLAALFCTYLFVHGLGSQRRGIVRGTLLAAVAAVLVVGPFLVNTTFHPTELTERAAQTSIFVSENPPRLNYYQRGWPFPRLLAEQVIRFIGVFNQFPEQGGVFPTNKPLMSGLLAALTLLGLGWLCLSWRDPRFVGLALWFWVGSVGVIVTVETPNLHRMIAAAPMLAFLPALVLDHLGRRIEVAAGARRRPALLRRAGGVATGLAVLVAAGLAWSQGAFYFGDYAHMERWIFPTAEGRTVEAQGTDTLVISLGPRYHMVNSGWVRTLAPDIDRGGLGTPGSHLPLALPADHSLAFILYFRQGAYLPYLQEIYPGGTVQNYAHPTEGPLFTVYRVPQQQWAAQQGAQATSPGGPPARVATLGAVPAGGTPYPRPLRWTAGLRVPEYWNYAIQVGPGPARLWIDAQDVLAVPAGTSVLSTTLALARGDHAVVYDSILADSSRAALFEWAPVLPPRPGSTLPPLAWRAPRTEELDPRQTAPRGLYGVVQVTNRPEQHRLDNTLATCCLSDQVRSDGQPYTATWTGILTAPVAGPYVFSLFTQGTTDFTLDGQLVQHLENSSNNAVDVPPLTLTAGPHTLLLVYYVPSGPGGVELYWTPPGGERSIVPPSVLSHAPDAGLGPPVPLAVLGDRTMQPIDAPLITVK